MPEAKKSPGRRTVVRTAASSLVREDIDAVHIARGAMRLSIQHAILGGDYPPERSAMTPVVDFLSTYLTRRCTIVAAKQEPYPDISSPQEERQIQNTDGAAQREDGRDGRCSRKPVSIVLHDTLLHGHMQDAEYRSGQSAGGAAPHAFMRGVFLRDSCLTTPRAAKPFRGPEPPQDGNPRDAIKQHHGFSPMMAVSRLRACALLAVSRVRPSTPPVA